MRMLVVTLFSTFLSALVISNAYMEKKQFYPTVVYLLSSNRSMGVMYVQFFMMVWFLCKFLKAVFFGTLRAAEVEHLIESSWYAILETFILLAAFHQELSGNFVAMVTILFVAKSFHWLAHDRVDFMERSPVITWLFHIRAMSLFFVLLLVDYLFIKHSWSTLYNQGPSVDIVFGLEYAIMFLSALSSALHYTLHSIDRQSEDPWENKTIYIRIINIFIGFFELSLYVSYMAFMLYVVSIPLHIARRVFVTAKNFQKSIYDVIASQQAIRHLNTLYPDATIEELEAVSNVCIICREEMVSRCKKLPCGHIFHTACLQSWFQRQQTCPTCRMDVLNRTVVNRLMQGQGQGQPQNPRHQQVPPEPQPFNPQQNNGFLPPMMFPPPMMPPMWPHPPQPQAPQQPEAGGAPPTQPANNNTESQGGGSLENTNSSPSTGNAPPPNAQQPQFPMGPGGPYPGFPGPFPFPPLPFMPPHPGFGTGPLTGESLQSLSAEQLQQLEGMERANVEARIAVLRDVQKLLDSAVLRLNQYSTVMAVISPPAGPGFPGYPYPPGVSPQSQDNSTAASSSTSTNTAPSVPLVPSTNQTSATGEGGVQETDTSSGRHGLFQTQSTSSGNEVRTEHQLETSSSDEQTVGVDQRAKEGVVTGSCSHTDSEIRQRRLERLHSMPSTSQQSLSPLVEGKTMGSGSEGVGKEKLRTVSDEGDSEA